MTRLPPQNLEAERLILGSMILVPEIYDEVRMFVNSGDFYRAEHQVIFDSIAKTNGDLVMIVNDLKDNGGLDKAGGPAYLAGLTDVIPSKTRAIDHAKIILEASRKRIFISRASDMVERCYSGDDFGNISADLEQEAFDLGGEVGRGDEAEHIGDIIVRSVNTLIKISEGGQAPGIMTGLSDIDAMTSGFRPDELIILAGRPSMGKTALAFNILKRAADGGVPVGAFSLEMGKNSLGNRMLADVTRINSKAIRGGWINDGQWPVITNAVGYFKNLPMYIDDTPALHISEMRSRARRMVRKHGIKFLAVDYLQLAQGDGGNREQVVADISRGLKAMAKELKVPVMALSQLNRSLESRPNKRPLLSDLRESGAIEQDADVIMFAYRDDYYDKNPDNPRKGIVEIIFGKQRDGPTGTVELAWQEQTCSLESLDKYREV